ncbi:MAG: hypothetical protein A2275_09830 [Bacteroidetes bacterium RIFOXYA12_FULL_35_11]|nr:MAG: hypothetical protein A2X01_11865 [Bacteroidetes bacterium GWF2_35_48]OFY74648.1 MAG: hypothetical protein A2275_09830 [Bacteroidetes bacterium RIFOXYA12_FULL_35_11]OFZ03043.1 MAG: hypothetical protein A2491_01585 [Bacteroidetes bacterium RIFOXYC12_FULL_35_7]HBX52562.1 hypothetical protein [Bacteroidales bacterium]
MKKIRILLSIFTLFALFVSCDKVEGPFIESIPIDTTDTNSNIVKRKTLILDFTGHRCIGCPRSHRAIDQIVASYGNKVIPVAIHTGFFAATTSSFPYDFRTNVGLFFGGDGATTSGYFEILETPAGAVNSLKKEDCTTNYASWSSLTAQFVNTNALLKIEITKNLSNSNQDVDVAVKTTALESLNKNLRLVVFVIEDSIISKQVDADADPQEIEHYEHKHVLRKALNGTWTTGSQIGDVLRSGTYNKDEAINRNFNFSLTGTDWNINYLHIVAFVFDNDTKEVLQVEEAGVWN